MSRAPSVYTRGHAMAWAEFRAFHPDYRQLNEQNVAAEQTARDERDREFNRLYMHRYRLSRPGYMAEYRSNNRSKITLAQRRYRAKFPERHRHDENRRRAKKFGNGGSHTVAQWLDMVAMFGGKCAYCGEIRPMTKDHKLPISRGGTDNIENIVPACKSCNCKKQRRTAEEYLQIMEAA